ncbi:hypothetical protein [Bradyrhizobium sp. SZCCHNRI3043]|uniref:hypothetical protein n=1 Tax=Bradyrhizobium sp. SZCCHNRI3043 TaxID=3057292 RepID=UPI0028E2C0AE|nr:hypothetical protein [Bradyrhizobium sp. SZCCHNRI3043]
MDFHLEHGLRLQTEPEYKNLYLWAIQEFDAQGKQIGHDHIPWVYTLNFTGTSFALLDSIEIESQRDEATTAPPEVAQRQHIRIRLRPGHPSDDGDFSRETTFSMFGTDRAIKSFELNIYPIADPAEEEKCTAWGSVSYTTEIDFRPETMDDCIVFYLYVKPDTFARYGAKIAHGLVDEVIFSVRWVSGFYSEWSPSISTSNVKVLTGGGEQKIALSSSHKVEPPQLGHVGKAELHINRRLECRKREAEPEADGEMPDFGPERVVVGTQVPAGVDPRIFQTLGSLKRAAWFIVCLLALIFVVTLSKH